MLHGGAVMTAFRRGCPNSPRETKRVGWGVGEHRKLGEAAAVRQSKEQERLSEPRQRKVGERKSYTH